MAGVPTRTNLERIGVNVGSLLCPLCNAKQETKYHIFMDCSIALEIRSALHNLWIDFPIAETFIQHAFTPDFVVNNLKKEHTNISIFFIGLYMSDLDL